ncbi:MAG: MBL fold metallo-hydrolase [Candidatus Moranbacteria bacterium]|nr:MBL fold metallo-hydrolase [Candidatus Moranbacteria bacterium]MBP9801277.1 MBL fold metallo-hydrolase [Candidatus Moranbacteria bacterium]
MNIQYYGDFCFKINTKPNGRATEDITIVTDIPDKETGLRAPQGEVHIVVLSHQKRDTAEDSALKGSPLVLDAPGEYAVNGITLVGLPSFKDNAKGVQKGRNTIFLIESEEIRLCFLGSLGHELEPSTIEKLGDVDILFMPVDGTDTLDLDKIDDLVRKIEPKVTIPMHYALPGMKISLGEVKKFCDVLGNCPEEAILKYNVKKKDLEGKTVEIVLLSNS